MANAPATPTPDPVPAAGVPPTDSNGQPHGNAISVALISCSSRKPRLNPYITAYVSEVLLRNPAFAGNNIAFTHIDLGTPEFELPLITAEPLVPAQLPRENPTPHYVSPQTRAWSALISSFQAFVFVTPQYNWSYPATVKNALDVLFHEWGGKAAAIVTYGQRGGAKAGDHLARVMAGGLKMKVVGGADGQGIPAVTVTPTLLEECVKEGKIPPLMIEAWREAGIEAQIVKMGKELGQMLN